MLALGAAPLFLCVTDVAVLSDEGAGESLEVVLLLLLLRFSLLPLALLALGCEKPLRVALYISL